MQSQWIATFAWSKNRRIINMLALLLDDYLKEEACMKYINAKNLLPDALVKELQSYIQGGYLYVPADQAQQKRWVNSIPFKPISSYPYFMIACIASVP